jgi:competence protein ComEC
MIKFNAFRPRRALLVGLLLFGICLGLYIARLQLYISDWWMLALVPLVLILRKKRIGAVLAALLVGMIIGNLRGGQFHKQILIYGDFYYKNVTITGIVSDDPGYNDKNQTEFHVEHVVIQGKQLPGRVRIKSIQAVAVSRGDYVTVSGKLNSTIGTSRQGSISYPNIEILAKNNSWVEKIRLRFFSSIYSSLPEPQASLVLGYLVGARASLPEDFTKAMSIVGLTHIIAVSGYNLTIIIRFVKKIFEKISAYQTVAISFLLMFGFLLVTGWSPSIMRAVIITGFSLLAWYYGRKIHPITLILLGASITAFINPLYIWGDVGWYLSFLAFSGVILLAPLMSALLFKTKKSNTIAQLLIETLSAQAFAVPYIILIFGKLSIISPLSNLLVVPFIPIAMLLGFITGVAGMFSPVLGLWLALPLRAIMTVKVWTVDKLATNNWAQIELKLETWIIVIIYFMLFALLVIMNSVVKRRNKGESIDWDLL